MHARSPVAILILALLATGCDEPALPADPAGWRLADEPVLELGSVDSGPAEGDAAVRFTRIAGAVALADGRYVVADAGEARMVVVAADGSVEAVVGRAGEGPGEFDRISNLWSTVEGGWAAWDSGLRRVSRFGPDGSLRDTHSVTFGTSGNPVVAGSLDQGQGGLDDGRFVLSWIVAGGLGRPGGPPRDTPLPDRMVYGLFGPDGAFQRLIGEDEGMIRYYSEVGGGPLPLSPFPWAALVGDTLVTTNGAPGELHFFAADRAAEPSGAVDAAGEASARPDRILDLDLQAPPAGDAWAALDAAGAAGRISELWATRVESIDRDTGPIPALGRLLADDDGRLWVTRYDAARDALALGGGPFRTGGEWTVFAPDGTALGRVSFPDDLAPLAVVGDRVLALGRDAFDVERFVVVRLER